MIDARAAARLGIGFGAKQMAAIGLLPVSSIIQPIAHGAGSSRVRIRHARKEIPAVEHRRQHAVIAPRIDYIQQDADILQIIMLFVTEMDK